MRPRPRCVAWLSQRACTGHNDLEDTGCLYRCGDAMDTDWQLLGMDSKPVDHNYCGSGPHMGVVWCVRAGGGWVTVL